jgi:hypothetical protein
MEDVLKSFVAGYNSGSAMGKISAACCGCSRGGGHCIQSRHPVDLRRLAASTKPIRRTVLGQRLSVNFQLKELFGAQVTLTPKSKLAWQQQNSGTEYSFT